MTAKTCVYHGDNVPNCNRCGVELRDVVQYRPSVVRFSWDESLSHYVAALNPTPSPITCASCGMEVRDVILAFFEKHKPPPPTWTA